MAKRSNMNFKKRQVEKREKTHVEETTFTGEVKSFVFTLVGVLAFIGLIYLMVLGMDKLGAFDAGYTAPTKEEVTITDEMLNIGAVFNRPEKEYYVIFDNYKDDYSSAAYVNSLLSDESLRVYKVDMNKAENAKYSSDTENRKASSSSDLAIKGVTLIKIRNGKIVKYLSGCDEIEEYLEK